MCYVVQEKCKCLVLVLAVVDPLSLPVWGWEIFPQEFCNPLRAMPRVMDSPHFTAAYPAACMCVRVCCSLWQSCISPYVLRCNLCSGKVMTSTQKTWEEERPSCGVVAPSAFQLVQKERKNTGIRIRLCLRLVFNQHTPMAKCGWNKQANCWLMAHITVHVLPI